MPYGVPLAWLQLKRERARFLAGVAGVAFAVTLIFMQIGFQNALFSSAVRFHEHLLADLVLVNPRSEFVVRMEPFARRRLYQAAQFDGVESTSPVYARMGKWRNLRTRRSRQILVIGFDPVRPTVDFQAVERNLDTIRRPDTVLFDAASRPEYGPVASELKRGQAVDVEIDDRHVTVAGLFSLGTSFGVDGSVITSDLNFLRMFPGDDPGMIEIGLIRLRAGTDVEAVRRALEARLPKDVDVLTRQGYEEREKAYWATSAPIGYVFDFGVVMGLIVGAVIVYQILFSDISGHLPEYATLKAIGYTDAYLFSLVFQEAVILAAIGYVPGLAISLQLYRITENATLLPMQLHLTTAFAVLGLTIAMCCASAAIALNKVRSADPAEIF